MIWCPTLEFVTIVVFYISNVISASSSDTWYDVIKRKFDIQENPFHNILSFTRDSYPLSEGRTRPRNKYDFVIIGAGSAGSVLGNRLSENGKWSILLLEAGGEESFVTDIPGTAAFLLHTDYNWGYRTQKVKGVCMAMKDQRCHWPRGKAIGGTSVINYMVYTRGFKEDWDRIESYGNPGWSWEDVLPYARATPA